MPLLMLIIFAFSPTLRFDCFAFTFRFFDGFSAFRRRHAFDADYFAAIFAVDISSAADFLSLRFFFFSLLFAAAMPLPAARYFSPLHYFAAAFFCCF